MLFSSYEEITKYLENEQNYSLVSSELPLIYNLNMIENISLIKEVHEHMPIVDAQKLALEYLKRVNLEYIAQKRVNECTVIEIFYVMFIRALMSSERRVMIEVTHSVVDSLSNIEKLLESIALLNRDKDVSILDLQERKNYYKDGRCNIIESS